jgi:hypothetical protein
MYKHSGKLFTLVDNLGERGGRGVGTFNFYSSETRHSRGGDTESGSEWEVEDGKGDRVGDCELGGGRGGRGRRRREDY